MEKTTRTFKSETVNIRENEVSRKGGDENKGVQDKYLRVEGVPPVILIN